MGRNVRIVYSSSAVFADEVYNSKVSPLAWAPNPGGAGGPELPLVSTRGGEGSGPGT